MIDDLITVIFVMTTLVSGTIKRTLKEGQDYSVDLEGDDAAWKQYTYTIGAHNFTEEGTYVLTIYSEDRATNASDNNSKGKRMEFVVDKTKPSIIISGVENNGQYRANSREMTLNVEDNVRLSEVSVSIDGKETVFDAAKIYEADGTVYCKSKIQKVADPVCR